MDDTKSIEEKELLTRRCDLQSQIAAINARLNEIRSVQMQTRKDERLDSVKALIAEGKIGIEIAQILNMSNKALYQFCYANGIKLSLKSAEQLQAQAAARARRLAIYEAVKNGESVKNVAASFGLSTSRVRELVYYGERRERREQWQKKTFDKRL